MERVCGQRGGRELDGEFRWKECEAREEEEKIIAKWTRRRSKGLGLRIDSSWKRNVKDNFRKMKRHYCLY